MTTTIRFVIGFCEVRLRFRQLSLCVQLGDLKGRFIDREQKIPRVNQLVVFIFSSTIRPDTCGVIETCSARIFPSRVHGDCM
ncbi:hypothetical protein EC2762100_1787 [Escherichia coli 2762100]|nr:hypothetical protein EC2762100_1787 [Escherichia coli 2762100]